MRSKHLCAWPWVRLAIASACTWTCLPSVAAQSSGSVPSPAPGSQAPQPPKPTDAPSKPAPERFGDGPVFADDIAPPATPAPAEPAAPALPATPAPAAPAPPATPAPAAPATSAERTPLTAPKSSAEEEPDLDGAALAIEAGALLFPSNAVYRTAGGAVFSVGVSRGDWSLEFLLGSSIGVMPRSDLRAVGTEGDVTLTGLLLRRRFGQRVGLGAGLAVLGMPVLAENLKAQTVKSAQVTGSVHYKLVATRRASIALAARAYLPVVTEEASPHYVPTGPAMNEVTPVMLESTSPASFAVSAGLAIQLGF